MSGGQQKLGYDQFISLDPPGKPPPDEDQDESTEHPIRLLKTWDSYGEGATGSDKQGKKKSTKSSKDKGKADKTHTDHRQERHKGEGSKGKRKESLSVFKSYPTTKEPATAESELPKKSSEELKTQVEKCEQEERLAEGKVKECDNVYEKHYKIVVEMNIRLKKDLEERDTDIKTLKEKLTVANTTMKKDLSERDAEIRTLKEKQAEANTAMKKDLSERDAEIKNGQEKLAEAQSEYKKAYQEVLQLYRTRDAMAISEMDKERSLSDKIKRMEMEIYKLNMEKRYYPHPEESELKKEVKELNARLRHDQRDFEIERNRLQELLQKSDIELTSEKTEIERKSVTIEELEGELVKFQEKYNETKSLFEKEKSALSAKYQEQL